MHMGLRRAQGEPEGPLACREIMAHHHRLGSSLGVLGLAVSIAACGGLAGAPGASPAATDGVPASTPSASPSRSPLGDGQRFELIEGDGTLATARVNEQLVGAITFQDAVLNDPALSGQFSLRPDGSFASGSELRADLVRLVSDDRDRPARDILNYLQHPFAIFVPRTWSGAPRPLPASGSWTVQVVGTMNINGVEHELTFTGTIDRDGTRLVGRLDTTFGFTDFGIDPPAFGHALSVKNEIRLHVDLLAEPLP